MSTKQSEPSIAMSSLPDCRQGQQGTDEVWLVCRTEEAKLLWAQGQRSLAMRLAWALLGSPAPMGKLQRSRLQSLLGKWLSLNRCLADWCPKLLRLAYMVSVCRVHDRDWPCHIHRQWVNVWGLKRTL